MNKMYVQKCENCSNQFTKKQFENQLCLGLVTNLLYVKNVRVSTMFILEQGYY